jgi:hypothetical protein
MQVVDKYDEVMGRIRDTVLDTLAYARASKNPGYSLEAETNAIMEVIQTRLKQANVLRRFTDEIGEWSG